MNIEAARTAAPLAAEIDARTAMVALLTEALAGNYAVTNMKMVDLHTGQVFDMLLGQLDAETSAACFTYAISIYQTQLEALNAQLAAL